MAEFKSKKQQLKEFEDLCGASESLGRYDLNSTNRLLMEESKAIQQLKNAKQTEQSALHTLKVAQIRLDQAKLNYLEVREKLALEGIRSLSAIREPKNGN